MALETCRCVGLRALELAAAVQLPREFVDLIRSTSTKGYFDAASVACDGFGEKHRAHVANCPRCQGIYAMAVSRRVRDACHVRARKNGLVQLEL